MGGSILIIFYATELYCRGTNPGFEGIGKTEERTLQQQQKIASKLAHDQATGEGRAKRGPEARTTKLQL